MLDDLLPTGTSSDQIDLEKRVTALYAALARSGVHDDAEELALERDAHAHYVCGGLGELPAGAAPILALALSLSLPVFLTDVLRPPSLRAGFSSLDASRTWICYWVVHSLALLGRPMPAAPAAADVVAFIAACQHPGGGFGGGPYQLPHLATTYAAVCTLVTLGGPEALDVVDRPALRRYLLRMCVPAARGGGMTMHEGGEVDVRGCYCALAACRLLGMERATAEVADACALERYVRACQVRRAAPARRAQPRSAAACFPLPRSSPLSGPPCAQSYEGGVGGEPWNEAHGGYTFCGLAALALAGRGGAADGPALLRWATRMQGWMEGGFMGRTCKLVDGCYAFWQGAALPVLRDAILGAGGQGGEAQARDGDAQGAGAAPDDEARGAAAARVAAALRGEAGAAEAGFVRALRPLSPRAAAQRAAEAVQLRLDAAVDASLAAEEAYIAAAEAAEAAEADPAALKGRAVAALGQAAALQEAARRADAHSAAAACAAPALLRDSPAAAAAAAAAAAPLDPLYDHAALQLWLLACCQGVRGGMRDKPGKHVDYYHTCYCLSGLSSAQHASGVVVGGARNALARADPLCNVVADRVAAAAAHFAGRGGG
jgi:protein farnesyltransferase subunit beta